MKTISRSDLSLWQPSFVLGAAKKTEINITCQSLTSNELILSTNNIVLDRSDRTERMCYRWHGQTVHTGYQQSELKPTNLLKTAIQVSLSEDFSGTIVESAETSMTYNGAELNIVTNNLGVEANVAAKILHSA